MGTCTFLDPRFKIHAFLENDSGTSVAPTDEECERSRCAYLIKEHILALLRSKIQERKKDALPPAHDVFQDSTSNEEETLSIWGKIDKTLAAITPSGDDVATKAKHELEMYLNEDIISRQSCPLTWWKTHALVYPNLAEIFTQHCHIVVTSVQCEGLFLKAGYVLSDRRTRLSRKRASQLVFLNSNYDYCK